MVLESPLVFDCAGDALVGVVAHAAERSLASAADLGVVIVVGGPQYRAGSHRQFVQLARAVARSGLPALRFDCRGMGDSEGEARSFEDLDVDIGCAIEALRRAAPHVRRIVLCGLCDGASAALLYLQRRGQDERVTGLIAMNPWVRTGSVQAETRIRHYYRERLLSGAFWRKLLGGRVALDAPLEAWRTLRAAWSARRGGTGPDAVQAPPAHFTDRMAMGALQFSGRLLIVLSGRDYTAKEFLLACGKDTRWQQVLARSTTRRLDLPQADHTFSEGGHQATLEQECVRWLAEFAAATPG